MTSNRQILGHLLAQGLHGDKNYCVPNIWDPYEMLMYFSWILQNILTEVRWYDKRF